MNYGIELINFSFSFAVGQPLFFEKVTLRIPASGLIFIIGKNGVGKSTFFRLLQGIVYPGEFITGILKIGDQEYDLENSDDQKRLLRRSILLHQNFDNMLAPHFTGIENLQFATIAHMPKFEALSPDIVQSEFELNFKIPLQKEVYLLSGGQRQLLAMMMMFRRDIDLALLDEPTAALDQQNSFLVMQLLEQYVIKKNLAVFAIVHDQEITARFARYKINIERDENGLRLIKLD